MSESPARPPTFNHVAMSVPAKLLQSSGRRELLDFYGEVFGWTEMPTMSEDGERLVLRVHSNEQFVFLVADDKPMTCPTGDHFGMSVRTPHELYALLGRARKYAERDTRVEIIESAVEDFKVLQLHSFYVRYQLPMMVEIQCFDWAAGMGPQSLPGRDGQVTWYYRTPWKAATGRCRACRDIEAADLRRLYRQVEVALDRDLNAGYSRNPR